ncbi:MAG: hypothetical protein L0210_08855 [Rhodospirillales bacterium]|nr:hypothetical protein [Rhodospirillales bacterium]
MSTLKIVICKKKHDADVAKARMEDPTRGFRCDVVRQCDEIIWDANSADPGDPTMVFEDHFVVICQKP